MKLIFEGNYFYKAFFFFSKTCPIKKHVIKPYYVRKSKLLISKFAQILKLFTKLSK